MPNRNDRALPYADASTIVRAHQKDAYFESLYFSQIQDALSILKGQRFINVYSEEILVGTKALYLVLTTLMDARTLGEEYVDLMYVNNRGKRLPRFIPKLGFVVSYAIVPYLVSRFAKSLRLRNDNENSEEKGPTRTSVTGWFLKALSSYPKLLDTLLNLHIAVFYFQGQYYSLSKRVFGLRYAFGHNKDVKKLKQARGDYSLLGGIILLQFFVKSLVSLKNHFNNANKNEAANENLSKSDKTTIYRLSQLERFRDKLFSNNKLYKKVNIDLSNPKSLPYISENSRTCMLCLSAMTNPSAALCGHIFCWECIVNWIREHPECPLCRQLCLEQNLLPLR